MQLPPTSYEFNEGPLDTYCRPTPSEDLSRGPCVFNLINKMTSQMNELFLKHSHYEHQHICHELLSLEAILRGSSQRPSGKWGSC